MFFIEAGTALSPGVAACDNRRSSLVGATIGADALVRLLTGYTARLRDLVGRADDLRYRRTVGLVVAIGALSVVISMGVWTAHIVASSLVFVAPLMVAFLAGLGVALASTFIMNRRRERVLRGDIVIAARQLERITRLGEQLRDHNTFDAAGRLEIELKRTDAAATLHYADCASRADYTAAKTGAR